MGIIYKYTNKVNGKSYVGQTINPRLRQNYHRSASMNEKSKDYDKKFYRAIRKYGWDSFEYSVLEKCKDSEMNIKERKYIEQYDCVNNGYNITLGGEGHQWSEEWKKWYSEQCQFKNASLTFEDIVWIRECYLDGKKPSEVYPQYSHLLTHYYSFMNIWSGARYGYIMPEVFEQRGNRIKLDFDKAQDIRKLHQEGLSYDKIAVLYGVGKATVRDVIKNRTWKIQEPVSTIRG